MDRAAIAGGPDRDLGRIPGRGIVDRHRQIMPAGRRLRGDLQRQVRLPSGRGELDLGAVRELQSQVYAIRFCLGQRHLAGRLVALVLASSVCAWLSGSTKTSSIGLP